MEFAKVLIHGINGIPARPIASGAGIDNQRITLCETPDSERMMYMLPF